MQLFRQHFWKGLPFPSPGDLPNPAIEPRSPASQTDSSPSEPPGKSQRLDRLIPRSIIFWRTISGHVHEPRISHTSEVRKCLFITFRGASSRSLFLRSRVRGCRGRQQRRVWAGRPVDEAAAAIRRNPSRGGAGGEGPQSPCGDLQGGPQRRLGEGSQESGGLRPRHRRWRSRPLAFGCLHVPPARSGCIAAEGRESGAATEGQVETRSCRL